MKILDDMECIPYKDGSKFFQKDEDGEVSIYHLELNFGVEINITNVNKEFVTEQESAEDDNVLGMLLCLNGTVETTIDDITYTSIPGTAVFGRPTNQRHSMRFPGGRYRGIAIGFRPGADLPRVGNDPDNRFMLATLMDRFQEDSKRPFYVPIEMGMLGSSILLELETNGVRNREFLRRRCAEVLHIMYCMREPVFADLHTSRNIEVVDKMCAELMDDLTIIPNIKQMCEDNDVNEFWFIRNFKKRYGYTPYEYHKMAKHVRAGALLLTDQHSVGDISKMIGYASQSKFSMAFKEIMGCRPKHYPRFFEEKLFECGLEDDDY